MTKNKLIFIFIIIGLLGFLLGYFSYSYFRKTEIIKKAVGTQVREDSSEYKYVNPLLLVANTEAKSPTLDPLQNKIEKYVSQVIAENYAQKVSVYFKMVDNGEWTGVSEDEVYAPSSMLKVVTLMAFLKVADDDPEILSRSHYYNYQEDAGQFYKPVPLKNGYHTGLTLLQQMVVYSDNVAMGLIDKDNMASIIELYKDLKLPSPIGSLDDFMSPRSYSRFFRALYNATYLSRTYSEQALKLLTYTNFDKGLRAGVPVNVEIAHKFGEHTLLENGAIKYRELHDCGIIYSPAEPYLLCVMTQGKDFAGLERVIAGISKIVFDYQKDYYGK